MSRPRPARPLDAPPAAPPEAIIARRRRRVLAAAALGGLVVALLLHVSRDAMPEARGRTGIPLPGLQSDSADRALASAPVTVFAPLAWEMLGRVGADPDSLAVPGELAALSGRPVSIAGFMLPLDPGATTLDFVLVPNMSRCWFCEAPDPTRSIYARAAFGPIEAEYDRPVRAFGVLDIEPVRVNGVLHSLTRLRAVRVERL